MPNEGPKDAVPKGLVYCFVAIVLAVSLVGFLRGVDVTKDEMRTHIETTTTPHPEVDQNIPEARSYLEMRNRPPGEGSGWDESLRLATSKPPREGKLDAKALEQALARRRKARAYDGAPPTIPHQIRQNSASECMACHGQGLQLGKARAQGIPHDNFTSCTQCHVTQEDPMPPGAKIAADPRATGNSFEGAKPTVHGPRAWSIAPPQIPHTTFMRENCMACHGDAGPSPMRTSHTSRKSCTQCHASSAEMDLRPDMNAWAPEP
jgi:nitrate reductase (cytochrome), electron transfer subunit